MAGRHGPFGDTAWALRHWWVITSGRTIGWGSAHAALPHPEVCDVCRADPSPDPYRSVKDATPGVRRNRRIASIVAVVAIVAVATLAIAYAAGWFDTGDTQTPIVVPDDTAPDLPDDTAPDLPDDAAPDDTDVVPDTTDDVAPDRPDDAAVTPSYREEPRANWDVTGVAAGDVLNVRTGPGITYPITVTLAPTRSNSSRPDASPMSATSCGARSSCPARRRVGSTPPT
jgi:hypothetical protein